jgi:hypothetical protein
VAVQPPKTVDRVQNEPALASASVALNMSVLYVGQAVGSAIGGVLYARDLLYGAGYVSAGFVVLALIVVIFTSRLYKPSRLELFRFDEIETGLWILVLTRFLNAKQSPPRIESAAGFRSRTL